jgi:radical SAM protein with 4Fe4S-binding SPASM domain
MTTIPMEYGPLVSELHERAARIRQPINGAFELTTACNLSCRMCYVRQPGSVRRTRKELSAAEWLDLARQAKAKGLLFLLLTGGEIFMRKDFFEIYEPLTRMGLILTLFTNGTQITPEIADRLAASPPNRMEITLYGATEATYEAVTCEPGGFAKCCAAIQALVARRVPLALKTTLTRHNVHELEAMRRMAHAWGLTLSGAWMLSGRPDGRESEAEDCRLPAAECVELEATDQASATEMREVAIGGWAFERPNNFYCKVGKAAFVINPYGDMNACLLLPEPAARPLATGFEAAWAQLGEFVDSANERSQVCRSCDASGYCGSCPAWSHTETGTLTEPSPSWCEIARARKERYERRA